MALPAGLRILFGAVRQFQADGASQMGAALAYYALFSTAPLLVVAVMLSGVVFGEQAAREQVRKHLSQVVGPETAREVNHLMETAVKPAGGWLAAALSGGTLLIGALGVFLHFRQCLRVIWRLESPGRKGAIETLISYLLAIVMVMCVGILLLLSLAASTALPLLANFLGKDFPVGPRFLHWLDAGVSFALLALFFAHRVSRDVRKPDSLASCLLWIHRLGAFFCGGQDLDWPLPRVYKHGLGLRRRWLTGRFPGVGVLFRADCLLRSRAGPGPT